MQLVGRHKQSVAGVLPVLSPLAAARTHTNKRNVCLLCSLDEAKRNPGNEMNKINPQMNTDDCLCVFYPLTKRVHEEFF